MLRLHHTEIENHQGVNINENFLLLDENIWQNCKNILRQEDKDQDEMTHLIPAKDLDGRLVGYGYQDNEANRELRMLRELRDGKDMLQFQNVFPEYKEVVIYGCNELAVSFAEYMDEMGIKVSVIGEYWEYFGRKSDLGLFLLGGGRN